MKKFIKGYFICGLLTIITIISQIIFGGKSDKFEKIVKKSPIKVMALFITIWPSYWKNTIKKFMS